MHPQAAHPSLTQASDTAAEVHKRYYQALINQSLPEMEALWLAGPESRCVHPGWPPLRGWRAIRASWQAIFHDLREIKIEPESYWSVTDGDWTWFQGEEHMTCISANATRGYRLAVQRILHWRPGLGWKVVVLHAAEMRPGAFIDSSHSPF